MARIAPMSRRTRRYGIAALGGALLITGTLAGPAVADDDDLPVLPYPYGLSDNPTIPRSVSELRNSGDPTCAAPPMPAPTNAGDGKPYSVPVRMKLTNGIMLSGYTPTSDKHGQPVPYAFTTSNLTGWIVARVELPSLRVAVEPADVTICPGSKAAGYAAESREVADGVAADPESAEDFVSEHADGSKYFPYPGTIILRTLPGGSQSLGLKDFVTQQVSAKTLGITSDGRVRLSTDLKSTFRSERVPYTRNLDCPGELAGTFDSEPKARQSPETVDYPEDTSLKLKPGPTPLHSILPSRPLTGAVVGGTATIGSNWFTARTISYAGQTGGLCGGAVNQYMWGYRADASFAFMTLIDDPNFEPETTPGVTSFPVPMGLQDFSLDLTITDLGLPKGLPAGYGFDS